MRKWRKSTRTRHGIGAQSLLARLLQVRVRRDVSTCQKLDTYDGTRNATIVDNFLFGLDQYFNVVGV